MEDQNQQSVGDRLAGAETTSSELRRQYARKIADVLEKRLTRGQIWMGWLFIAWCVVLLPGGIATFFRSKALRNLDASSFSDWMAWLGGMTWVAWLAIAIVVIDMLRRRRKIHRLHDRAFMTIAGIFQSGLAVVLLRTAWVMPDAAVAMQLTTVALILLGLTAVVVVLFFIEKHHLQTQEKLLEIELRLAEMAEQIGRGA